MLEHGRRAATPPPLVTAVAYPDGSTWQARYDDQGNLLAETDAEGHTTEYLNGPDGLPHTIIDAHQRPKYLWWNTLAQVERYQDCSGKDTRYAYDEAGHLVAITDALGRLVRYEYDRALRLAALINENHAAYRFAYDASDRLLEEQRIDHLTRRFAYNAAGHLVGVEETGYGAQGERPVRHTTFERDAIGRLLARFNDDARYDYQYDDGDRLLALVRLPGEQGKRQGLQPNRLAFAYDRNGRLTGETSAPGELAYQYDALGNLATLGLPDGRALNHLYYGSGHLHQINLDGRVVTDLERDDLHREILRTQGRLTSRTGYDALGRKAWQFASSLPADKLSSLHNPHIVVTDLIERRDNPIHRRYRYDAGGELVALRDKLRGDTHYAYDAAGRLLGRSAPDLAAREHFAYDPAANLVQPEGGTLGGHVKDNRLRTWQDQRYDYDAWGNLVTKRVGKHLEQRFAYDAENHLIHAATYRDGNLQSEARYHYDSLGRRIAKVVEQDGATKRKDFLWQGLRLLEERSDDAQKLYVYEPASYAPLARVDGSGDDAKLYYFHTDQIGTPLDVTDEHGALVWQASYKAWGEVEQYHMQEIEQNLRFQGQYFDDETGLHYNTFRYYDPGVGRFVTQDPIGLLGGSNLYQYAPNPNLWVDPWGLAVVDAIFEMAGQTFTGTNPTDRIPRIDGDTVNGLRVPNRSQMNMHAEIEAMLKAKQAGLKGGNATLTIQGLEACTYCRGDIKTMARALELDQLTVHNNGKTVVFNGKEAHRGIVWAHPWS